MQGGTGNGKSRMVATGWMVLIAAGCGASGKRSDEAAPTVSVTSPVEGAVLDSSTVSIKGDVAGKNLDAVQVVVAGFVVDATLDESTGTFDVTVAGIPDGATSIAATAYDEHSHAGTSVPITVIVDATAPVVTILSPASVFGHSPDPTPGGGPLEVLLPVSVVDGVGTGAEGETVTVREGATDVGTGTVSGGLTLVSCMLAEGAHDLTASVADGAGHVGTSTLVTIGVMLYQTVSYDILRSWLLDTLHLPPTAPPFSGACAGLPPVPGCPLQAPVQFLDANKGALGVALSADPEEPSLMSALGFKLWILAASSGCGLAMQDPTTFEELFPAGQGGVSSYDQFYGIVLGRQATNQEAVELDLLQDVYPDDVYRAAAVCTTVLSSLENLHAD